MQIQFKQWLFQPRIFTSAIAILVFSLFIKLGLWQLDRAEFKEKKYNTYLIKQAEPAINLKELMDSTIVEDMLWRAVYVDGYFNNDDQILLDNRVLKSKAGYYVYTPFKINNSNNVVLVNRGWIEASTDRTTVPEIRVTEDLTSIKGIVKASPLTGIVLKELPPEKIEDNIYRVQKINIEELKQQLELDLLPYIVRLEPDSNHGYTREWNKPGSDQSKHLGYAYQWFAFAVTLLIIYLLLNIKKIREHEQ